MFTATETSKDNHIVDLIAAEMASGVERAVDCWMSQMERALTDMQLTSLGRLNAAREIVERYKKLTGKTELAGPEGNPFLMKACRL